MFEQPVTDDRPDAVSCADALVASIAEERAAVARRLARVADWADYHCPEAASAHIERVGAAIGRSTREAARILTVDGVDGTPSVMRSAVIELGMLLQTSTGSAQALLRDVLELRHRLPRHWDAVLDGRLDGWKGRQVATLTRDLTQDLARVVDAQVIDAVIGLPWARAKDVVVGRVIAADRTGHEARLAEDENRRFVSTRRASNAAGLRTMIARGYAGDIARLEAMVAHIATALEASGDTSVADFRRAKALAMLANPALACVFLAEAQRQPDQQDTHDGSPSAADDSGADVARPDPEPAAAPSAVEQAVAFGQVLRRLGARALDRLRPRSVLHLHLAAEAVANIPGCGVARVDDPVAAGPISIDQLAAWLRHDRVVVRPVVDPTGVEPVDDYEIPVQLREAVRLLNPYEIFPHGTLSSRQADLDHPIPYVALSEGGPPGQTSLENLGPLGRAHHLAKTFSGFSVQQLAVGVYLWRSPTGHRFLVDHRGTRYLGRDPGDQRKSTQESATPDTGDSPMETRFRDLIVRHTAA